MLKLAIALFVLVTQFSCGDTSAMREEPQLTAISAAASAVRSTPAFQGDLIEHITARGICRAGKILSVH